MDREFGQRDGGESGERVESEWRESGERISDITMCVSGAEHVKAKLVKLVKQVKLVEVVKAESWQVKGGGERGYGGVGRVSLFTCVIIAG
jgi:hypothetical protein